MPTGTAVDWSKVRDELGITPDDVLAIRLDCSAAVVARHRCAIGRRRRVSGPLKIDWDAQPLGKVSDTQLAHELGVHPTAVRHARERRGLLPLSIRRLVADVPTELWREVAKAHPRMPVNLAVVKVLGEWAKRRTR